MITVYKYPATIGVTDHICIEMHQLSEILCVKLQHGEPYIWARVDTESPKELRCFRWAGTGHDLSDSEISSYVGTIMIHDDRFVFHLFECHKPNQNVRVTRVD